MAMCLIDMHSKIMKQKRKHTRDGKKKCSGVWKFFNMVEIRFGFIERERGSEK